MALTLTTEAEIIRLANTGANPTITGTSATVVTIGEAAEAEFMALTNRAWIAGWSSVNQYNKLAIGTIVASRAAFHIVQNTRKGFVSEAEWEVLLDSLDDTWKAGVDAFSMLDGKSLRTV